MTLVKIPHPPRSEELWLKLEEIDGVQGDPDKPHTYSMVLMRSGIKHRAGRPVQEVAEIIASAEAQVRAMEVAALEATGAEELMRLLTMSGDAQTAKEREGYLRDVLLMARALELQSLNLPSGYDNDTIIARVPVLNHGPNWSDPVELVLTAGAVRAARRMTHKRGKL